MVAAAHPLAVEAGYGVLKRGGSALDAAIAVQMVLGLVEPESSGIGGGAFLLHWSEKEKKLRSYDGRETAPAAAHARSVSRFNGKNHWNFVRPSPAASRSACPACCACWSSRTGATASCRGQSCSIPRSRWRSRASTASPRLRMLLERERFQFPQKNPEYAAALRAIARGGADAFYQGALTADIVRAVRSHAKPGGITAQDFADYRALEREPVCAAALRRWRICSMGPPSSGGVAVLQILGILERTDFARAPPQSAAAVHYFAEAGRLAYADRARYLGDPDFTPVPVTRLLESGPIWRRGRSSIGERVDAPRAARRYRSRRHEPLVHRRRATATPSP